MPIFKPVLKKTTTDLPINNGQLIMDISVFPNKMSIDMDDVRTDIFSNSDVNKEYVDSELSKKQNLLTAGSNITISEDGTISSGLGLELQVVDTLPTTGVVGVLYLVPKVGSVNDTHDEYVWVDTKYELIGNTSVDLSAYYTKTQIDSQSDKKIDRYINTLKESVVSGNLNNIYIYMYDYPGVRLYTLSSTDTTTSGITFTALQDSVEGDFVYFNNEGDLDISILLKNGANQQTVIFKAKSKYKVDFYNKQVIVEEVSHTNNFDLQQKLIDIDMSTKMDRYISTLKEHVFPEYLNGAIYMSDYPGVRLYTFPSNNTTISGFTFNAPYDLKKGDFVYFNNEGNVDISIYFDIGATTDTSLFKAKSKYKVDFYNLNIDVEQVSHTNNFDLQQKLIDIDINKEYVDSELSKKQNLLTAGSNITISEDGTISSGLGLELQVVDTLPTTGVVGVLYLVPKVGSVNDTHDEYVWVDTKYELIGNTSVDLSAYYTKTQIDGIITPINSKITTIETELPTKATVASLATKIDKILIKDFSKEPSINYDYTGSSLRLDITEHLNAGINVFTISNLQSDSNSFNNVITSSVGIPFIIRILSGTAQSYRVYVNTSSYSYLKVGAWYQYSFDTNEFTEIPDGIEEINLQQKLIDIDIDIDRSIKIDRYTSTLKEYVFPEDLNGNIYIGIYPSVRLYTFPSNNTTTSGITFVIPYDLKKDDFVYFNNEGALDISIYFEMGSTIKSFLFKARSKYKVDFYNNQVIVEEVSHTNNTDLQQRLIDIDMSLKIDRYINTLIEHVFSGDLNNLQMNMQNRPDVRLYTFQGNNITTSAIMFYALPDLVEGDYVYFNNECDFDISIQLVNGANQPTVIFKSKSKYKADFYNYNISVEEVSHTNNFDLQQKLIDIDINKEYVDSELSKKQNLLTAGSNITISEDGTISSGFGLGLQVVDTLPTTGVVGVLYLVPKVGSVNYTHDEYVWVGTKYELIGNTSVDLSAYYTKTQIDAQSDINKEYIDSELSKKQNLLTAGSNITISEDGTISSGLGLELQVVDTLPTTGVIGVLYLVPKVGSVNDTHDEYVWVDTKYELIGNTSVDLSAYYTKTQIDAQSDINKEYVDSELSKKQNLLTAGSNITISEDGTISSGLGLELQVVDTLPTTGVIGVLYLVPKVGSVNDTHDEYVWVDTKYELIGNTSVDLSAYYTKTQIDGIITPINSKINIIETELPTKATVASLTTKVDKVDGKVLSTNDYTTIEKTKLTGIETGAQANKVTSVSGRLGSVILTKSDVGLANVDNTSDINKPISNATITALNLKLSPPPNDDKIYAMKNGAWIELTVGPTPVEGALTDNSGNNLTDNFENILTIN